MLISDRSPTNAEKSMLDGEFMTGTLLAPLPETVMLLVETTMETKLEVVG